LLSDLSQECDHSLSFEVIGFRQVDLVTENDKPLAGLQWGHDQTSVSLFDLTVVIEGLQDKTWRSLGTEVDKDHLHVSDHLQSGH
jgi:hypothetical protein